MKQTCLLAWVFVVVGCNSADAPVKVRLQALKTCGDVEQLIRDTALAEMNREIDKRMGEALGGNNTCQRFWGSPDSANFAMPAPSAVQAEGGSSGSKATQVSKTNNQVAGVDEADFVKNDDKYLYIVSDEAFRIIDAWPPQDAKEIANVPVTGRAKKLFVHGDRALIYSSVPRSQAQTSDGLWEIDRRYQSRDCTYGYNCSFTGDGNPTKITVFDIGQRSAPKLVRELYLSGSYLNARRVGDAVFTVMSSPAVRFDGVQYYPDDMPRCGVADNWSFIQIVTAFQDLRKKNTKIIEEMAIEDWLPSVKDRVHVGKDTGETAELLTDCAGFYRSGLGDGDQFTTLLALDMAAERPVDFATIISRPGAVYASADALYVSVPHERQGHWGWFNGMEKLEEASTVHKFDLDAKGARAHYAASGVVKGRVLNQFAMDEHEGDLRIATTTGYLPSPDVHSTMTVLRQNGQSLIEMGIVDELAPSEDIRSVRFDGDRAFVVTFKKTDPLFVFDLSNPKAPKVLAELKIPGFSTYMHMMDDDHLLTIGYDADDQGSFAWFTGVMLQIFDVSDLSNPRRTHKEVIGTRGSSSEALTNHLAFTYFAPKDLLALPMTICEDAGGGGSYGTNMTFSGLLVYDATVDEGFQLTGRVDHPTGAETSCHNWWTDASSQVERSIVMDDYVYSISRSLIKVNALDALSDDVNQLSLE